MARIYKESRYVLQLLIGKSYGAQYEDVKIFFYTKNPSNQVMAGDEITIKGNIAEVKIGSALFDNLEDGLIKYIVYGTRDGIPFIEERQSNYFLKTPTTYTPTPMPEEVVLGELTTMIVENGVFEYNPTDVDAWKKATIEVNVPSEGGSCNLEDKWITPSMGDRDDNGYVIANPSKGFDGLSRVVINPTTIYNEGVTAGKAEGSDLNIGEVTTTLGVGEYTGWARSASQFGLDGITEITIDGRDYQEWTKGKTLLEAHNTTDVINITENGIYRPVVGYDGFAVRGYNVAWVTDVIPTIDTDVEMWVKPYDGASNMWPGFIGSQVSDEDNTTFQIRKKDGANAFCFKFGEQSFEYGYENERWYRLRMNRRGVWINGEQVCGWNVQAFEENPNPLMINGIYNLNFESDNYRMNYAAYGYIYFHNSGSLLVPNRNGNFIGDKNRITQRPSTSDATLSGEKNLYPNGYTKVTVNIPQNIEGIEKIKSYNQIAFEIEKTSGTLEVYDYSLDKKDFIVMNSDTTAYVWSYRTLSEGITQINQKAFNDYAIISSLKTTTITILGERAFLNCVNLKEVELSMAIGRLGAEAFDGCTSLNKIVCKAEGAVILGTDVFRGLPENGTLYLKDGVNETPWLEKLPSGWTVERI